MGAPIARARRDHKDLAGGRTLWKRMDIQASNQSAPRLHSLHSSHKNTFVFLLAALRAVMIFW